MRIFTFIIICFLFFNKAYSVQITGTIYDNNKQPLPFVSIFIKGTTQGTTSNTEGRYQIDVAQGSITIVYKLIGYKQTEKTYIVSVINLHQDIYLQPEHYELKEAVIKANEDPAYGIIKQAIAKRRFYLDQVDSYKADVYIKGWQRITKHPEKIFGQKVNLSEVLDTATGVVYLSESVSDFNFKRPNQIRESIKSSKVSGSNRSFSFNRASFFLFNFYENILDINLCPRGAVSPIANNALLYYNYKLVGSFFENQHWVHKIEVLPKRKFDPVFSGFIYIQDNTWRIHSLDLYLNKNNQLQFVDTFKVNQVMLPAQTSNDIWMPVTSTFYYTFGIFGFEGDGVYTGIASNYDLNPTFDKNFFNGDVITIEEGSNKKDSSYWNTIRPIPLTPLEQKDYVTKDSMAVIKESKPYLDSADAANNKLRLNNLLLTGYQHNNRYRKFKWGLAPFMEHIVFNTVEGLNIGTAYNFTKRYEKQKRTLYGKTSLRYAFAAERFFGQASVNFYFNRKNFSDLGLSAGSDAVQYNARNPIRASVNTFYTLAVEKNYMKLYQKDFLQANFKREISKGLFFASLLEFSWRKAMVNQTDYVMFPTEKHAYSSNNPRNSTNDNPAFENHESLHFSGVIRYTFRQNYYNDPDNRHMIKSDYPIVYFRFKQGIPKIISSDVNYTFTQLNLEDELPLGLLGSVQYNVGMGKFLNNKSDYFIDYRHFNGNKTYASEFRLTDFNMLPYYSYSTTGSYYEAHIEYNLGGLLFNKIPVLRKAFFNEIVSAHYLKVPNNAQHFEFSVGVEKLGALRFDLVSAVAKGFKPIVGIRFGVRTGAFGD